MSNSSWRDYARPIIARVLKETQGQDEIAAQRGTKKKKNIFGRKKQVVEDPNQERMF